MVDSGLAMKGDADHHYMIRVLSEAEQKLLKAPRLAGMTFHVQQEGFNDPGSQWDAVLTQR